MIIHTTVQLIQINQIIQEIHQTSIFSYQNFRVLQRIKRCKSRWRLRYEYRCNNSLKYGHLSLLNALKENDTNIEELSSDGILHGEPKLFILLMLLFDEVFHGFPYHILHLILGNSGRLCIV